MKVAAIDIGSNSIHMIVAVGGSDGMFEIIDREKDVTRLGAGAFKSHHISESAYAAGLATITRFKHIIDRHNVDDILAVATSAVREAENGAAFVQAIRRATGIQPRIITGKEEARLIHLAVRAAIDLRQRNALLIDIGGGSVEIAFTTGARLRTAHSLKLGVLRLRDEYGKMSLLNPEERHRLTTHIHRSAASAIADARRFGFDLAVGTSGTLLSLGLAVHLQRGGSSWVTPHGRTVRLDELRRLAEELVHMTPELRARVAGLDPDRADTIHFGALLIVELMKLTGATELLLCDAAIREGVVYERLLRADSGTRRGDTPDVRRNSVLRLVRVCGQDLPHTREIVKLALQLFDQTVTVHRLGGAARELLEYAAHLHDVGRMVGFERHEQLSYFIVRYGDLRGFTDQELETLALIARFHRRAKPKVRFDEFARLSPSAQQCVTLGAAILRVAEGLDRRHLQVVRKVRCRLWTRRMRIYVDAPPDADIEVFSAGRKAGLLSRILNRKIDIQLEDSRVEPDQTA